MVDINTQLGTAYTLALTDAGKIVEMNNANANTVTIPNNTDVALPVDTVVFIQQEGAGQTAIAVANGVTLQSAGSARKISSQYGGAFLYKRGTNDWRLVGALSS